MAGANRVVIDGVSYPIDDATAVDFEEQQALTDAQKARARSNIGAASQDDMTSVQNAIGNVPSGSNLQDEVADLKSAFDLKETDLELVKDATVTKKLGTAVNYTANEEGSYWRYINGTWQKPHTTGTAYFHIVTYPVTAGKVYRVTGRHYAYTPLATYWTDSGTEPIGYSPDGYSSSQPSENVTLDLLIPEGATKMLVTAFPLGTFPTVQEITYENSIMSVAQKIANQDVYCTFDEAVMAFEKNGTGLDITLPYRFFIHYLQAKASEQKTIASGVSSMTYQCTSGSYLVYDLTDNTVKQWKWSDIASASKDNYILFAAVHNGEIIGGVLKPYLNRYKIKLIEGENYTKTLHNIRESGLGVNFDPNSIAFKQTSAGLDITFPYRCFIFGDKTNNIYMKNLNGLSSGTFTISWNMSGYIILNINTGVVDVETWGDVTTKTEPFIVLAAAGKKGVVVNGVYYNLLGAGALLPFFNQYMLIVTSGMLNNRILPPYYYFANDYLPNKAVSVRNKAKSADVSFGFLTDYHVGFNTGRSMLLMKYIADKTNAVPFVLFGGDVPKATGTEAEALAAGDDWLEKASIYGKDNVYQCKGNHDYMINASDSTAFHADVKTDYYYICKPTEHKVHGTPDRLYDYFDDDINKVRYIILDNYDAGYASGNYNTTGMSQAQYEWLINLLNVDGYDMLVLSHQTSDATLRNYESVLEPLQEILKAFVAKGTLSYSGNGVSLSADFTGTTSRLICHLSGHSHDDESHVDNGVLSIVSVCDAYYTSPSGYTRTYSTINEQAFDIFCVTKDTGNGNGSIEIVRIGAGSDRTFTF